IEPLGVIDQTEKASLSRCLGEESEDREGDEEPVRSRTQTQSEGDVERVALRARQTLTESQDRGAELLNGGEWELHLALDPSGSDNLHGCGRRDRVVEESRLSHPSVAVDDEDPA